MISVPILDVRLLADTHLMIVSFPDTDQWLLAMSTQLIGFSIGGICTRFLVAPQSMIWPGNLVPAALLNTLHAQETAGTHASDGISRRRFFIYVVIGCFFYSQLSLSTSWRFHFSYDSFHVRLLSFLSLYRPIQLFMGLLDRSQQCQGQPNVWHYSRLGYGSPYLRLGSNCLQWLSACRPILGCCQHWHQYRVLLLDPRPSSLRWCHIFFHPILIF